MKRAAVHVLHAVLSLDGNVRRPRVREAARLRSLAPGGIAATPARAAALLAAGKVSGIAVLWRAELVLGTRRLLASPFLPPDGKRVRFRPVSARPTPDGFLCRYRLAR